MQKTFENPTRRTVLKAWAIAAAGLTGCTPLRVVFGAYPEVFDQDPERLNRVLVAFADAVVPGILAVNPEPARAMHDPYYGLAKYRSFMACELTRITTERYRTDRFEALDREERTTVLKMALAQGGVLRRLVGGAIHLTQVACYSAIYDAEGGCALIDFEGQRGVRGPAAASYPVSPRFTPQAITIDGNPA